MYNYPDMSLWQGRIDDEESVPSLRWHQVIHAIATTQPDNAIALLGFCSDEGVIRNKGRAGAKKGPDAIRSALANQAFYLQRPVIDAGNVTCEARDLESAQALLGETIETLLNNNQFPVVLGGGHEVAFGSYQGIERYLNGNKLGNSQVGIINFDAHLDLRTAAHRGSSGTPFKQICLQREAKGLDFRYCVIGMNPTANTAALVQFAETRQVLCIKDIDCTDSNLLSLKTKLTDFMATLDYLYLTVCLDVFPACVAPGVSAPAALGVSPSFVIKMIQMIKGLCQSHDIKIIMADIAEMNPAFDHEGVTARLAARLIDAICSEQ